MIEFIKSIVKDVISFETVTPIVVAIFVFGGFKLWGVAFIGALALIAPFIVVAAIWKFNKDNKEAKE